MLKTFNIMQTYTKGTAKPLDLSVFKLFIFTVVIREKSCFEQKYTWSRFASVMFKLHEIR